MNTNCRINIIIVIYQSLIDESKAYASLRKQSDFFNLFVVDNSTQDTLIRENAKFAEDHGIIYRSKSDNLGLSRAYNLALDLISKRAEGEFWMITLDQDTELSAEYLSEVIDISNKEGQNVVYCPSVFSKQGKISPLPMHRMYTRVFQKSENQEILCCINSGLLWHSTLFENLRYDESIFLDMIDYDIFMQLHQNNKSNSVIPMMSSIHQEFSGDAISTLSKDRTRFGIYTKDFTYFCRKWHIKKSHYFRVLYRRALNLSISHRSFSFLSQLFSNK